MNLAFFYIVSVDTALDGYFWKLMSIRPFIQYYRDLAA